MEQSLTKDQIIYLLLLSKIDEPQLCRYIIGLKNSKEKIEAYNYHYEHWEKIASKYFKCLENRYPTYSYIFNGYEIIAKQDKEIIDAINIVSTEHLELLIKNSTGLNSSPTAGVITIFFTLKKN